MDRKLIHWYGPKRLVQHDVGHVLLSTNLRWHQRVRYLLASRSSNKLLYLDALDDAYSHEWDIQTDTRLGQLEDRLKAMIQGSAL